MILVRALLPVGVGLAIGAGGTEEPLSFHPEEGSSVRKTIVHTGDYTLDELSLYANGQDVMAMVGSVDMNMTQETRIEVTDVYAAVSDGRPTRLLRTFDLLEASMEMDIQPPPGELPAFDSTSELEGLTVAFTWNEDSGEYEVGFPDGDGDENLLEGLVEDLDLRVFLPEGEVEEGDSWTVELRRLETLIMPGGDLKMRPEGMEVDEASMEMFEEMFSDFGDDIAELLDGECVCTFEGIREVDDQRVAEVSIVVEVSATIDLTELIEEAMRAAMEMSGADDSVEFSLDTADFDIDFEGEGVLRWNVEKGRVHSYSLSGDAIVAMDLSVGVDAEGQSMGMDASMELSGEYLHELTTAD